jgi:hypothetical protein
MYCNIGDDSMLTYKDNKYMKIAFLILFLLYINFLSMYFLHSIVWVAKVCSYCICDSC